MNRPDAWLIALTVIVAGVTAFAIIVEIPSDLPQQQALDKATPFQPSTTSPADDAVSLVGLDVNLRRQLADPTTDPSVAPPTSCLLLGTSIDAARPMAFVQLPDGTSRWLSLDQTTADGLMLNRVDRHSATITLQGRLMELTLPDQSVGATR